MAVIEAGDSRFDAQAYWDDAASVAPLLLALRARRHHALCHCTVPARKLVVRRINQRHYLAVWPGDGTNHDFDCPFHRLGVSESEIADSGLDDIAGTADSQAAAVPSRSPGSAADEPVHRIRLDFALNRLLDRETQRARPAPAPGPVDAHGLANDARPPSPLLNLPQLLQFLMERSRLNCWGRRWSRDWWRIRREVTMVAEQTSLGNRSLSECLLVPHAARRDLAEQADAALRAFVELLKPANGAQQLGLVLGEVKGVQASRFGYRLDLRSLPFPLFLSGEQHGQLVKQSPRAMLSIGREYKHPSRVLVLCVVQASASKRYFTLRDAAVQLCSRDWIPCETGHEVALANTLIDHRRAFVRPLRLLHEESLLPDFVLRDTPEPMALEVIGTDSPKYVQHRERKAAELRRGGHQVWTWRAKSEPMPPLPEPATAK